MADKKEARDLSVSVMQQIKGQNIKMKPHLYFVLGSIFLGLGMVGAAVLTIFFVNLLAFRLRVYDPLGFLGFGKIGLSPFFHTFPWFFFGLTGLGLMGGMTLLRRFDFSYRRSFLSVVIVSVVFILSFGFLVDYLGFNEKISQSGALEKLYHERYVGSQWVLGEVHEAGKGEIDETRKQTITVLSPAGEKIIVVWNEKTLLPTGADFKTGDKIRIIGKWQENTFWAKGIRKGGLRWRWGIVKGRRFRR